MTSASLFCCTSLYHITRNSVEKNGRNGGGFRFCHRRREALEIRRLKNQTIEQHCNQTLKEKVLYHFDKSNADKKQAYMTPCMKKMHVKGGDHCGGNKETARESKQKPLSLFRSVFPNGQKRTFFSVDCLSENKKASGGHRFKWHTCRIIAVPAFLFFFRFRKCIGLKSFQYFYKLFLVSDRNAFL